MTAQQLADNAFVQAANLHLQSAIVTLRRVPVLFWQRAVIVLALIWAAHNLASLFWVLYPTPELAHPKTIAQPLTEDEAAGGASIDLASLQALNWKGQAVPLPGEQEDDSASADIGDGEDVAETTLNLKLQGILHSSKDSGGRAVIADGNKQAIYQIGEVLPQGRNVKLAKVLADRVILDNNGNAEALFLYSEEDFKGSSSIVRSVSNAPMQQKRKAGGVRKSPGARDGGGRGTEPASGSISRDKLRAKSINEVVRFSLHQENGQVMGYRIRPGRDRETFEKLGLKNNDIVTTVNGIAVTDRSQLREMYRTMRTATEATLEVNRDGAIIPVSIRLETE